MSRTPREPRLAGRTLQTLLMPVIVLASLAAGALVASALSAASAVLSSL